MMSWCVLLMLVAVTGQKDAPRLDELLARVARYVQQFEQDFEIILSDEQYEQKTVRRLRDEGAWRRTPTSAGSKPRPESSPDELE